MIAATVRKLWWTIFAIIVLLMAAPASAQIYRWTDERGVSHYAEGLDSVPERYRSQAVPLGLQNRHAPEPTAAVPTTQDTIVRFAPGRHILVDVRLNDSASARLILDTGSGQTMISPRALVAAGVSLTRGAQNVKRRGIVKDAYADAQRVVLDSLELGTARATRMAVNAYDMDWTGVDGLLGQDFLGRFKVTIDPTGGVVTISAK